MFQSKSPFYDTLKHPFNLLVLGTKVSINYLFIYVIIGFLETVVILIVVFLQVIQKYIESATGWNNIKSLENWNNKLSKLQFLKIQVIGEQNR